MMVLNQVAKSSSANPISIQYFQTENTVSEQIEIIAFRLQRQVSLLKTMMNYLNDFLNKTIDKYNDDERLRSFFDIIQTFDNDWIRTSLLNAFLSIRGEVYSEITKILYKDIKEAKSFDLRKFFSICKDREDIVTKEYEKILKENKHIYTCAKRIVIVDDIYDEFIKIYNELVNKVKNIRENQLKKGEEEICYILRNFYKETYVDITKLLGLILRFINHFELVLRLFISLKDDWHKFTRSDMVLNKLGIKYKRGEYTNLEFIISSIIYTIDYKHD